MKDDFPSTESSNTKETLDLKKKIQPKFHPSFLTKNVPTIHINQRHLRLEKSCRFEFHDLGTSKNSVVILGRGGQRLTTLVSLTEIPRWIISCKKKGWQLVCYALCKPNDNITSCWQTCRNISNKSRGMSKCQIPNRPSTRGWCHWGDWHCLLTKRGTGKASTGLESFAIRLHLTGKGPTNKM